MKVEMYLVIYLRGKMIMSKTDECKKIVKKESLTIKECTELLDGFKTIVNKADELIMSVVDMKSLNKLIRN